MNTLKGRVAVITGAGRGIGREHALLFASEGAEVVVNDLGGNPDGTGADASPATQVVDEERMAAAADSPMDPGNISPFVAYLSTELCPVNGRAFFVVGGQVHLFQPWAIIDRIETEGRWTVEDLELEAAKFAEVPFALGNPFGGG